MTPINKDTHATKRWLRPASYAFAAKDSMVPLVAAEFPRAMLALPIAFRAQGEAFVPVAVMGLRPGKNLLVAADGRWLASYVPALFRADPFRLLGSENGQQVLCIDEDRSPVTDGPEGEPFFDEGGQPGRALSNVLKLLGQVNASRDATARMCAGLQAHGLIQPWPITVKGQKGDKHVEGLYRIDEAALNALQADALLELRDSGALKAAYCQLLSMQHLPVLGRLIRANAPGAHQPAGEHDPDLSDEEGIPGLSNIH
jgi:hypothetical protein